MRERKWGRIVNFSSVLGMAARSGRADYVVSKHAMLGLTRATAAEIRDIEGITCNAICPGSVLTPNTEIKINELAEERSLSFEEATEVFWRDAGRPETSSIQRRSQSSSFFFVRIARTISPVQRYQSIKEGRRPGWSSVAPSAPIDH